MGEAVVVVTVGPQHEELFAGEESGRAVAGSFGRTRQRRADLPDSFLDIGFRHQPQCMTPTLNWPHSKAAATPHLEAS